MTKKAIIITLVSLGVAGAGIFGGIKAYQNYQKNNLTAEVQLVSNISSYVGENGMSSSGIVTNDFSQDVYILDEKTITEVFVEEGQSVKAGDPLISYDMTMSHLELEMKELDVSANSNRMEAAKRQLEKLKNTKPVAPRPDPVQEPEIPDVPVIPEVPEIPDVPAPEPQKSGDAYNYIDRGAKPNAGKGTEEDPYVYLCMPECYVLGDFINSLKENKKKPIYVSLEIHKDNVLTGRLLTAWEIGGDHGFPHMAEDSRWLVRTRSQLLQEEEPELPETEEEPELPEIEEPELPEQPEGYTAEELAKLIKEKEQEIRDLDLQQRKEELELAQMKKISDDGVVKAEINGVVKNLAEKDNLPTDGSPFLTVAGSEGLYVSGYLSELQLEDIKAGQIVYANSWESGRSFEATITEISKYPEDTYNAWGDGNPNVSYYPYTAYIEDTEGLQNGEYVDLTMNAMMGAEQANGIYIEKAYVRDEDGRKYVLKAGEDNRLTKQYVKTGKTYWGYTVEIVEGLTMEDRIAFPYGKTAKEGIKVKETE